MLAPLGRIGEVFVGLQNEDLILLAYPLGNKFM